MSKKEILWREILFQATEKKQFKFTQKELAERFGVSTSTVFNALKIPRESGTIEVTGKNFSVRDTEKFLYLWATRRNVNREIIYKTHFPTGPKEIEGMMPDGVIFGAYSAYAIKYQDAPADYDKVYVYADSKILEEIKKRFPKKRGYANLFALKADPELSKFGVTTPDVQTFADIWNLKDWFAKDFLEALKRKIIA
jgi:transcriptional regulator with XRE-family HTH domain